MIKLAGFIFLLMLFEASAESRGTARLDMKPSFGASQKMLFEGGDLISSKSTEASYSFNQDKAEFCCDREYTSEAFYEMSEHESNSVVQKLLGTADNSTWKPPAPKGQR